MTIFSGISKIAKKSLDINPIYQLSLLSSNSIKTANSFVNAIQEIPAVVKIVILAGGGYLAFKVAMKII